MELSQQQLGSCRRSASNLRFCSRCVAALSGLCTAVVTLHVQPALSCMTVMTCRSPGQKSGMLPGMLQHARQPSQSRLLSYQDLASASYFLPSYDLRQATRALESLQKQLDQAQSDAAPKQKFAFGGRKPRKSRQTAEDTTAAATNAAADGVAQIRLQPGRAEAESSVTQHTSGEASAQPLSGDR